ncbi:hypothetical protein R9X47_02335 [Wukongibacter baidiensis]|uniref:hypothetical protein n=1 Tax=Wukongibacter baidiensis TaxID=1723361 RepID=UPI003D7F5CE8
MKKKLALELFDTLNNLYKFLRNEDTSDIEQVMKEMQYAIKVLNEALTSEENNIDNILVEIKEICRSFFPPHGGLTDFFIWRDDFRERKRVNEIYEKYKNKMWSLLKLL